MSQTPPNYPQPNMKPRGIIGVLFLILMVGGVTAVSLQQTFRNRDVLSISIAFPEGHGLKEKDKLVHRGIEIGIVKRVILGEDLNHVVATVELAAGGEKVACTGSQFWIVRPAISISGVNNLGAVLGKSIAVQPGNSTERQTAFKGLPDEPLAETLEPGGIDIVLICNRADSVTVGAPVKLRNVPIGKVRAMRLSPDGSAVEIDATITRSHRNFVRKGNVFWKSSAVRGEMGILSGAKFSVESFNNLLLGGIEMAILEPRAEAAGDGMRFTLHEDADKRWLGIDGGVTPVGAPRAWDNADKPVTLPAKLTWTERTWYRSTTEKNLYGYLTFVNGKLWGPRDLFTVPKAAVGKVWLNYGEDQYLEITAPPAENEYIVSLSPSQSLAAGKARFRAARHPENAFLIVSGQGIYIPAAQLESGNAWWDFKKELTEMKDAGGKPYLHGLPILAESDGAVIGLCDYTDAKKPAITLLPEAMYSPR
jgi:paraquat-inducible protein B